MPETVTGRVIAAFGRHVLVRITTGERAARAPLRPRAHVVCGDQVRCRLDAHHEEVHVIEVLPRRTALYRSNLRGATEPVVANLTQLLVVLAPAAGAGFLRHRPLPGRRHRRAASPRRWC